MGNEWNQVQLSDVVEMQSKKINAETVNINNYISTENMLPNKEGIQTSSGLPNQTKYLEFIENDVLFSNIRTYFRKVWAAKFNGGASNDVIVFRTRNENILNQSFLYYLLSDERFIEYTVTTAKGTKMPRGDKSAINKYKFNLPEDIGIQIVISSILGSLDKKIDLNRQMNQTLEEMAQALYKSWFVDFDPVIDNALEVGSTIPDELTPRSTKRKELGEYRKPLPDNIKNLFPSEFEFCDELDKWIPKGWKNGKVDEVAYVIGGGTPSTKIPEYFCENGIPWLSPKDLSGYEWKFISKGATDITELGLKKSSANLMPKGTVLFSSRAPIGYIAVSENEICTNQGFKSLVPKDGMVSEFILQYLKIKTNDIEAISTGSTFKEISGTAMKSLEILIPPKAILNQYKSESDAINDKGRICQKESSIITNIRDTLLPKLISGELRI